MIGYSEIRDVHLEISSLCNARCPLCPRNFRGYPYNDGYTETNLTLEQCKTIFKPDFLKQLNRLWINGNFGDAVMNPETPDIVEYFRSCNSELTLEISTNGSARDAQFWQRIAKAGVMVSFCLDGLEDTHHLYRQNTSWSTIVNNARIFIDAGGYAVWKMIKFNFNEHQIEQCRAMAEEMGMRFDLVDYGRNAGPVFDKHGKLTHVLGYYRGETNFDILFNKKKTDLVLLEDITLVRKSKISCETKKRKSIYISATGDVYPCCYTGFSPKTYGHGEYLQAVNAQISPLISSNNALDYSLENCIEWFTQIESSWSINDFESGRLVVCDDNCGFE